MPGKISRKMGCIFASEHQQKMAQASPWLQLPRLPLGLPSSSPSMPSGPWCAKRIFRSLSSHHVPIPPARAPLEAGQHPEKAKKHGSKDHEHHLKPYWNHKILQRYCSALTPSFITGFWWQKTTKSMYGWGCPSGPLWTNRNQQTWTYTMNATEVKGVPQPKGDRERLCKWPNWCVVAGTPNQS